MPAVDSTKTVAVPLVTLIVVVAANVQFVRSKSTPLRSELGNTSTVEPFSKKKSMVYVAFLPRRTVAPEATVIPDELVISAVAVVNRRAEPLPIVPESSKLNV